MICCYDAMLWSLGFQGLIFILLLMFEMGVDSSKIHLAIDFYLLNGRHITTTCRGEFHQRKKWVDNMVSKS